MSNPDAPMFSPPLLDEGMRRGKAPSGRVDIEELEVPVESIRAVRVELLFFPDQIIVRRRYANPSPGEPTLFRIEDRVYQPSPEVAFHDTSR